MLQSIPAQLQQPMQFVNIGEGFLPLSTLPLVEIIAAWMGIDATVTEFQVQQLWLEGDSLTMTTWTKYFFY